MTTNKQTNQFYSLTAIQRKKADYNIIFGERSNGKTYAALLHGLTRFITGGEQFAYVRRWREDIRGRRADSLFANHIVNGVIEQLSKGKYNDVIHVKNSWFLSRRDEDGGQHPCSTPMCYAFALSEQEHEKSSSYPNVTTIIFDEFLTRRYYLPDEFMLFMNLLSTIIRQRDNVHVYMLGNTVNKFCPYFTEMGLKQVPFMEQGTIDVYRFGDGGATVAVEYCAPNSKTKKASNKYFCFDNEKLKMITGGKWEMAAYPRLPRKYKPNDVLLAFFIEFGDNILQGNIIQAEGEAFLYIHQKTTPIRDTVNSLVYSLVMNGKPNYKRKLLSTASPVEAAITRFFATDKVFYQSNEVGEIVRNYIRSSSINNLSL